MMDDDEHGEFLDYEPPPDREANRGPERVMIELSQADGPPQFFVITRGDSLTVSLRAYVEGADGVVLTTMPLTIKAHPQ
jgi:hypothetical protein